MLFSYESDKQQINNNNKCRRIAGHFDCHVDAAVQGGVHRLVEHIQGFRYGASLDGTLCNTSKT